MSNLFSGPTSGGVPADSTFDMFGAPPPSEGSDPFASIGNQPADDPFAQIAANLKAQPPGTDS